MYLAVTLSTVHASCKGLSVPSISVSESAATTLLVEASCSAEVKTGVSTCGTQRQVTL